MAGGKVVYVPILPPANGATTSGSSSEWTLSIPALEAAITPRTKSMPYFSGLSYFASSHC